MWIRAGGVTVNGSLFDLWFCSAQSAFGGKSFIHYTTDEKSEEFFKFDVVDRNSYNEAGNFGNVQTWWSCFVWQAARSGKILIDSDMTLVENGIEADLRIARRQVSRRFS